MTCSTSFPPRVTHGGPQGDALDARIRIDASSNVNAYVPAPAVVAAVRSIDVTRLPDPRAVAPRRAAADHWHRPIEELAFGAGTSELLLAAMLATLRRDDPVVLAGPIYGEYARTATMLGARPIIIPSDGVSGVRSPSALIDAVRAAHARVAVVCAPGNPLGERWTDAQLSELGDALHGVGAVLLLDQSYDAFLDTPLGDAALPRHPAVLHLRSLTKDHAIPGLRAGFACGPVRLIERIEAHRVPWSASAPAQAAAVACFRSDALDHVHQTTRQLRHHAHALVATLRERAIAAMATDVHWILCDVGHGQAVAGELGQMHGVRVRPLDDHGFPQLIRITVGLPADNGEIARSLVAVLGTCEATEAPKA